MNKKILQAILGTILILFGVFITDNATIVWPGYVWMCIGTFIIMLLINVGEPYPEEDGEDDKTENSV